MATCEKCLMPEGKLNVRLDNEGVCNYCRHLDKHPTFPFNNGKKNMLRQKLEKYAGQYDYDALVGLSGGKDSSYVAWKMKTEYGLKIKSFTFENGFLTGKARENIDRIVERIGLDHFYYKPDWGVHRSLYRAAVKILGDPCVACGFTGYFLAIKLCHELKIPFFVHGRSPFQMYRNYYKGSNDLFIQMNEANLQWNSFADIARLYRELYFSVRKIIDSLLEDSPDRQRFYDEFFLPPDRLDEHFAPEFIGFFLFEPYEEGKIKEQLTANGLWTPMPTHADCHIHAAAEYMFKNIHGIHLDTAETSAKLRFGAIDRQKARQDMATSILSRDELKNSIAELCSSLGINERHLYQRMNALKESRAAKFGSH